MFLPWRWSDLSTGGCDDDERDDNDDDYDACLFIQNSQGDGWNYLPILLHRWLSHNGWSRFLAQRLFLAGNSHWS